jgi:hypothetical protein
VPEHYSTRSCLAWDSLKAGKTSIGKIKPGVSLRRLHYSLPRIALVHFFHNCKTAKGRWLKYHYDQLSMVLDVVVMERDSDISSEGSSIVKLAKQKC